MDKIKYRTWYGGKMHFWGIEDKEDKKTFVPPIDLFSPQMQSTGLLDEHGKEIYEGDILKVISVDDDSCVGRTMEDYYKVIFSPQYHAHHGYPACFVMWAIGETNMSKTMLFGRPWHESVEVIGNIYENPELLNNK